MKWGYSGYGNKVINARSETAFEKPMFRKSMQERRCLLPASGYYEWRRTPSGGKSKQKYALYRAGQPTIFMAGLWREEQGERLPVFVILTKRPYAGDFAGGGLSPHADPGRLMGMAMEDMVIRPVS